MNVFALSVLLFQLCNAGMLPLAVGELSIHGQAASYIVPAAIIVPQLIAAACSPWAGALARAIGRRPVLLAGFIVLPLRAVLFAFNPAPEALDFIQVLDGVGATVLGLMIPLIAADLTRKKGHLNLAIGSFDLASGLGATLSTTFAGWAADRLGAQNAFLGLALVGGAAIVLLALAMPETRPKLKKSKSQAAA
jgi:MFS family permease